MNKHEGCCRRPTVAQTMMDVALSMAKRSTCQRRQVGCVLVNRRNHVIATGYNGVAAGMPHCLEKPCAGVDAPSGEALERCEAIHAEANALLQCKDVYEIETAYCTTAPCVHCVKLLMNTSCKIIVYSETYPHGEMARELWLKNPDRRWFHLKR